MSLIVADDLHVALGGRDVLDGLHLRIERGRSVGLLGPNGSGKTTLLRTIGGLLPYRGRLTLAGREVSAWRPRDLARQLAFVRQSTAITFDFTVEEVVLLGRSPHKRWLEGYSSADRARARGALAAVDLDGFFERSVLELSGGELQRVLLAQALVQESPLLLLDEPTAHLDVHHQYELMHYVAALVEAGQTVVTVFHDLELAARFAHHLIVLQRGRIVAAGPPQDVLHPDLVASVFQMQAEILPDEAGALRVHYLSPSPTRQR